MITNHMLTTLRLAYDTEANAIRLGDGLISLANETDSHIPHYPADIRVMAPSDRVIDFDNIASIFAGTMDPAKMQILALLMEAQVPAIPVHYKVLSLIRALEVLLPDPVDRQKYLEKYELEFAKIEISERPLKNALPELRTRCAHGTSRGGAPPLVAPIFAELDKLVELLRLLRRAVVGRIGSDFGIKFEVNESSHS
ncbi:hypothetical protein HFP57_07935 [Parasphingopyxis algicola]|uniref:hypothetical protein n=1 Tax=Parasphingopyxis algicola TaxID=2026624 RepID=UPI0015A1113B|nr:hypothetical protein [Parasphingopyxis algicola]QLC24964.1 hypothetical protein HFP57_07935 [Parasphingopyxis algicola]